MLKRFSIAGMLSGIIIFIDQYTKWWVMEKLLRVQNRDVSFWSWLQRMEPRDVLNFDPSAFKVIALTPFLNFVMVWNRGISFGLFDGRVSAGFFIILSVLIAAGLTVWLWRSSRPGLGFALSLVIGGAVGNILDRIRFGAVIDFIDFHIANWHYPAFNVADSSIVVGALWIMLDSFLEGREDKKYE